MSLGCQTGSEDRRQPFNYQSPHYWVHTTMSIGSICFVQSCIDHTSYLSGAPGTIVIWRNLSTCQIVRWRNSPHDRLSCGKNLHMRNLFWYDLRAFAWRKKLSCGEICPYNRLSGGEILHMTDCHVEKNLHMRNVNKI